MREIDKHFLTIFKDLKITPDTANPGTDEKPNYVCYIGNKKLKPMEVIRLVKKYQDDLIRDLLAGIQ